MSAPSPRRALFNDPPFPPFNLTWTHVRDVPSPGREFPDQVIVSVPWTYDEHPEKRYPVVYLCDGYWDYPLVWGLYSHLLYDKVVPEYILVGLSYGGSRPDYDALRKPDLGPAAPGVPAAGDYLARLQNHIIPFIEAGYACDPSFRCLAGVSIGGAFALSALFRAPGCFQAVIALSPTVMNFDRWVFRLEDEHHGAGRGAVAKLTGQGRALPARVFLAAGEADDPRIVAGIREFDRVLAARKYRFLEKQLRVIDGEKHAGLKGEGMTRGLRHVFATSLGDR